MPKKDGFQACSEVKQLEQEMGIIRKIPIVALTASIFPHDIEQAKKVGMIDALFKPLRKNELEKCIKRYTRIATTPQKQIVSIDNNEDHEL